jgi:hypothetical protein
LTERKNMIKRISTVTARSLLKSLVIISPLLLLAFPVKAQTIPACRNITPSAGRVCYTEHPFSARQRDEGGTRTYNFIVERVAQNWVIIDYEVIREGGFGAVSNPTGSIVSSNGNASIVNVTQSETQRLSEVKSQLEAKAQGCYPPVCGQIQGQLSSVDREIQKLSNYQSLAVQSGGNEKISFSYTTSVSCNRFACGGGASIQGKVKVYQRYLGNPNELQRSSESLVRSVLRR